MASRAQLADCCPYFFFFFSSRRRHTRFKCDWSSDVCSSDLAAQDVRFEKAEPVGIGNLEKRFGLKDSEVVNQDVSVRHLLKECLNTTGGTQVRRNTSKVGIPDAGADLLDRGIDSRLRTSVDDDLDALRGERCIDGESNPGGLSVDNPRRAVSLRIHCPNPRLSDLASTGR